MGLPFYVQVKAYKAYRLWRQNPQHPSLEYKPLTGAKSILFSARVNLNYRVLGYKKDNVIYWFWIGPHHEYDRLLKTL